MTAGPSEREAKLEKALRNLLSHAEGAEVLIESDRGSDRSLEQIERDGHLPAVIVEAREALRNG